MSNKPIVDLLKELCPGVETAVIHESADLAVHAVHEANATLQRVTASGSCPEVGLLALIASMQLMRASISIDLEEAQKNLGR